MGPKWTTRLLPLSSTYTSPVASLTATPEGSDSGAFAERRALNSWPRCSSALAGELEGQQREREDERDRRRERAAGGAIHAQAPSS